MDSPTTGGPRADAGHASGTVLHVDMDAFFASVEVRRRPELRGRPVVVGGVGPRGVVSSASYEARKSGVRSAMPTTRARRLCPDAVFLRPDMAAYAEASRAIMAIFADVTPLVEPLSVDEAFLDVAGAVRLFGPPPAIAAQIRARVRAEQRLTCSVGVASTKFMAKLASTRSKPDGLLVVSDDEVVPLLHSLPVDALWGVGERTAEVLARLGLRTVGQVATAPLPTLRRAVGEASAAHLHDLSWGRDPRRVTPRVPEKSVSAETTFEVDVTDPESIRRALLSLATSVGARLRAGGHAGRTVAIKVRLDTFQTMSRSRTLPTSTDVAREIFDTAWALYRVLGPRQPIRLIGVRVEGLTNAGQAPRQLALGEREHGWREAERAVDEVARRFGAAVAPASLLNNRPTGSDISPRSGRSPSDSSDQWAERDDDPLSDPLPPS